MHRGLPHLLIIVGVVVALTAAGSVDATSTSTKTVSVHVQRKPSVADDVHISFRPTDHLPEDGYYYAVIVLRPYKHYTQAAPPPCATSSDMEKTDYAYPHARSPIDLTLTPKKSAEQRWCRGGVYSGGIYAVPYPPPCNSTYPCRSEPYKEPSPCFEIEPGRRACGVVAKPKLYRYPDGLPFPLAKGTRIIAYFHVTF